MTSQVFPVTDKQSMDEAVETWNESEVIVDAILGTGIDVRGSVPLSGKLFWKSTTRWRSVFAVDIPSGVDAGHRPNTGCAVMADLTATYGFRKLGMALHPGVDYCGAVEVVDISIPLSAIEKNPPRAMLSTRPHAELYYRLRMNSEAHKDISGTFSWWAARPARRERRLWRHELHRGSERGCDSLCSRFLEPDT